MAKQVRIIPKRREPIDLPPLTEGLLDVLASLTSEQRRSFEAEGERLLKKLKGGQQQGRGSAA